MGWREVAFRLVVVLSVPMALALLFVATLPGVWTAHDVRGLAWVLFVGTAWVLMGLPDLAKPLLQAWRRWRHWRGVRRHLLEMGWGDNGGSVYKIGCSAKPGPDGVEVRQWWPIGHPQTIQGPDAKTTAEMIDALARLMWEQG